MIPYPSDRARQKAKPHPFLPTPTLISLKPRRFHISIAYIPRISRLDPTMFPPRHEPFVFRLLAIIYGDVIRRHPDNLRFWRRNGIILLAAILSHAVAFDQRLGDALFGGLE